VGVVGGHRPPGRRDTPPRTGRGAAGRGRVHRRPGRGGCHRHDTRPPGTRQGPEGSIGPGPWGSCLVDGPGASCRAGPGPPGPRRGRGRGRGPGPRTLSGLVNRRERPFRWQQDHLGVPLGASDHRGGYRRGSRTSPDHVHRTGPRTAWRGPTKNRPRTAWRGPTKNRPGTAWRGSRRGPARTTSPSTCTPENV